MPAQIKHLFVLMLENRSFDHMLGFMKADDYNIEGIDSQNLFYNEDRNEKKVYVSNDARPTGDLKADPNHHFDDVTQQLYGISNPRCQHFAGQSLGAFPIALRRSDGARVTQFPSGCMPMISECACWAICRTMVTR